MTNYYTIFIFIQNCLISIELAGYCLSGVSCLFLVVLCELKSCNFVKIMLIVDGYIQYFFLQGSIVCIMLAGGCYKWPSQRCFN